MISPPQILQTDRQFAASIHLTIPRTQIRHVMGPGIKEVMSAVGAQGIGPTGPWFTHHLKMAPDTFDFEICVPVSAPVRPTGRVLPVEFPPAKVARTLYQGGYEGLSAAWPKLDAWLRDNRHSIREDLFECYVAGPESGEDSSLWRTELSRVLVE